MFLSPSPLSLLCAFILCFPLAFFLTVKTTLPAGIRNYHPSRNGRQPSLLLPSSPPAGRRQPLHQLPPFIDGSKKTGNLPVRVRERRKPAGRPRKLAFMFLTTTPLPFAPLWELFFRDAPADLYNVYVHADPTYNYTTPFTGVFSGRVIRSSKPTRRLTPTLAAAARRLLAEALVHDKSNHMFALLSPQCIPLHSFNFTYAAVAGSDRSFIEVLANESWAIRRWSERGETAMLPEVRFEDFRIGSQFFILTRKHAMIVVRDRILWPKFSLPCVAADECYPEEQYFPTLLNMVDPQGCTSATLTHVDWSESHEGHPRTYNATEVGPELIRSLRMDRPRYGNEEMNGSDPSLANRHDPFLFARKFSPGSLGRLMAIAKESILKD